MMKKLMLILPVLAILAMPAFAADFNRDGLDDNQEPQAIVFGVLDVGDIAIVDTGSGTVATYISRLGNLGYTVTAIPLDSNLETLLNYDLVILPVGHGSSGTNANFNALAADYHTYVETGGGLWISQPNPYDMPGEETTISWVPYLLRLNAFYDSSDCPITVVDDTHCITAGYPGAGFSFVGDTVLEMGPEWSVLVEGPATGNPGVIVAEYGAGRVLAEFGHPSLGAICGFDDTAARQYVECTMGHTVGTESITLEGVKALFK